MDEWGLKYKLEIYDKYDVIWTAYFHKPYYDGNVINLKGGENPITFEFSSASDELIDPIKVVNVSLSIIASDNFIYEDIVSTDLLSTYIEIYQSHAGYSYLYWTGFVDPSAYEEPYTVPPYPVTIACTDGLVMLEAIPYAEEGIPQWNKYQRVSAILLDIFSKIGVTRFNEFINLYEYRMDNSIDDSPFDQLYIDTEVFTLNEMDCRTVLETILRSFNANIRLKDGLFWIYRPVDLIEPVLRGRQFVVVPTTKYSITVATPQSIYRRDYNTSALRQIPDSRLMVSLPMRKVTITQDYAYKDSWIDNWRLRGDTVVINEIGIRTHYKDWYMGPSWIYISTPLHPYKDGVAMHTVGRPSHLQPNNVYIQQQFGRRSVAEEGYRVEFSYTYTFVNHTGAARDIRMMVEIKTADDSHYLVIDDADNRILKWQETPGYIDFMEIDVPEGEGHKGTFTSSVVGIPVPGPFVITIYGPQYTTDYQMLLLMIVENVVFKVTSEVMNERIRSKKEYRSVYSFWERFGITTKWATKYGTTPKYDDYKRLIDIRDTDDVMDKEHVVVIGAQGVDGSEGRILGDVSDVGIANVLQQFAGALALRDYDEDVDTPTEKWKRREWDDEDAKPLVQLCAEEVAHQYSRAKYMIDLKLLEEPRNVSGKKIEDITRLNTVGYFTDDYKIGRGYSVLSDRKTWPEVEEVSGYHVDMILLSGFNGACEFGTELGVKEVIWGASTTLLEVAEKAVEDFGSEWETNNKINVQVRVFLGEVYFIFTSLEHNYVFTTVVNRTGGSLDGTIMSSEDQSPPINFIRYQNRDFDSYMFMGDLNLNGASYPTITIKYRIISNAAPGYTAPARIYYSTEDHTRSTDYRKNVELDLDGEWHTEIVNMRNLDAGGDDWIDNTITGIWFDVSDQFQHLLQVELGAFGFASAYVMNRGTFNVRTRQWQLDLIEIIK